MNSELMPRKHIRLNETVLGLGAVVLSVLEQPLTLDEMWALVRDVRKKKRTIPEKTSFEDLVLAVDFLFALGAIQPVESGKFVVCD